MIRVSRCATPPDSQPAGEVLSCSHGCLDCGSRTARDAIYRAWRAARVDPDLAHEAVEQVRAQDGRNVIDIMESRFDVVESRFDVVESRFDVVESRFDATESRFAAVESVMESRFDELKSEIRVLQRVIWPLIGILATTVFGLLYRTVAP